jgi:UDP-galactopyranose mutase
MNCKPPMPIIQLRRVHSRLMQSDPTIRKHRTESIAEFPHGHFVARGPTLDSSPTEIAATFPTPLTASLPDILCFSHLRWHFVTQRPQHLLVRAARDRRVFFWEEPIWHQPGELPLHEDGSFGMSLEITQEQPSLWVIRPHITWGIDCDAGQRTLLTQFMEQSSIDRYLRWYYTPMALGFSGHLPAQATIYDCMDELTGFLGAPPQLAERERQLFSLADVVFTGGISLYEAKRLQHANVHAFPSSIDVAHFARAAEAVEEPVDQVSIPHPRAGFFGVVDERLDIALLGRVAALRPEVHFVVLGPIVKIDPATLPQGENIHYLGAKKYEELPAYLAGWDVALLPFALNDATRFISPTKTPEYLAAGKPVVSTPIRDVVRSYGEAGLVAIADTPEAFAAAIDRALAPPTQAWRDAVASTLARSSWDSTWTAMQQEIQRVQKRRSRPAKKSFAVPSFLTGIADAGISTASHATAPAVANFRLDGHEPRPLAANSAVIRRPRTEVYDYLVVGAGFAGSVLAERLASQLNKRVLVLDKRDHIAGNAYDFHNSAGVLIHQYGPHIFHTNSDKVVAYLSQFTAWRPYEHRVLSHVDGHLLPVPINLDTINRLYNLSLDAEGMQEFLAQRTVTPATIRTSEEVVVSRVGRELYEKFFRNYTRKQWGLDPSQLDASVAGRIPVRFDRDDRYFSDIFQAMPLDGYTRMFERMLDHPLITVRTGVDYRDAAHAHPDAKVIYTGPIDEYFGFRFGPLPYRSLHFKHETHDREVYQPAPVVNYPNDHDFTRITEFKYLTGQRHAKTSIVFEYPRSTGDPYYPIPRPENAAIYAKYRELAERDGHVHFCGRLANYKYLNMDQVVAQALATFRTISARETTTFAPLAVTTENVRSEAQKWSGYTTPIER